jgi:hypothetical protein
MFPDRDRGVRVKRVQVRVRGALVRMGTLMLLGKQ